MATFTVLLTGFEDVDDHVEYQMHVTHEASGRAWSVQRRFSDFAAVSERLAASGDFAAAGSEASLPEFPEKYAPGYHFLMGRELVVRRVAALQRWLEGVSSREDIALSRELQVLLGVRAPGGAPDGAPTVRGHAWCEVGHGEATVELDVAVADLDNAVPIDAITATLQAIAGRSVGHSARRASSEISRAAPGSLLRIPALPCGEEVTVEVRAQNAVGESAGTLVHLLVPGERSAPVLPGARVQAVWAGDGRWYDGVVKSLGQKGGTVIVTWLRPAPLSGEAYTCVCESGGDDTAHRSVPRALVRLVGAEVDAFDATAGTASSPPPAPQPPPAPRPPLASQPSDTSAQAEADDGASDEWLRFSLGVRLDESRVQRLEWKLGDALPEAVDAFVLGQRLRPLFRDPLLAQAESMVHMGRRENEVDIVDLL